ncbi:MAG: saccharopine dehydrogenase NADP-binding domain-containing protein [Thermoleophilaceae bacterium]
MERDLDVVVFGATGFVGRLTAEHLAAAAPPEARIGLAGRSRERLEEVRSSLGERAAEWPLVPADSNDPASLRELAERTRVVATTVGPYRAYGLPLVEACAAAGTHYADLTGEVLFMREAIDRFDALAEESGARIVNSCGFDSIPSDLGVLMLHEAAQADGAGELERTTAVVMALRGGLSGGTFASLKSQLDEVKADSKLRRTMFDPYALSPDRASEPKLGTEGDLVHPKRDQDLGIWVAPFVMASFNTRVVRRSNAIQDWAYGRRFDYHEVMSTGTGPLAPVKAAGIATGLGAFLAGLSLPPTRKLLDRILPDPGEGPSEKTRRNGYFAIDFHTRTSDGRRYKARVAAQGDPGYAATAVMLGESALCLALDEERLPPAAGILTPATGMGAALTDRLRAAGQTFTVAPAA